MTLVFFLLIFSFTGIILVLFLYPAIIWIISFFLEKETPSPEQGSVALSVSMIIALRNSEAIIEEKIKNSLALRYPSGEVEIIFSLDGSTDKTEEIIKGYKNESIKVISSPVHQGKVYALNRAVQIATNDVLVFSDADSIIGKDSLIKMLAHLTDKNVGGVCGQRVIYKDKTELKSAQKGYIKFDSTIKSIESRIGSITSNDGKLYSIRRFLYLPINTAAVDDLYVSLSVIKQGFRYVFEPEAKVHIRVPSRNPSHEIIRRRRIVSTSLRCLFIMKEIFNPAEFGIFSFELFINKVLRRFLPVFLILFFFSNAVLAFYSRWVLALWILQIVGYGIGLTFPVYENVQSHNMLAEIIRKISSFLFYFSVGNLGTLLGFIDFLCGRKIEKWEPLKSKQ